MTFWSAVKKFKILPFILFLVYFWQQNLGIMNIKIKCDAFKEGEKIPVKYTCEGINVSPKIGWKCSNPRVRSFVLFMEDLNTPNGKSIHWILFNIPAHIKELHEEITTVRNVPDEVIFGTNDFGKIGYTGPCPNKGIHKYSFKIFGLDKGLPFEAGATKFELLNAMKGHILAKGRLTGKYGRKINAALPLESLKKNNTHTIEIKSK